MRLGLADVVVRLGKHPAGRLGLDLESEEGRQAWWLAACLLAGRGSEDVATAGFRRLAAGGLDRLEALAARPADAAVALEDAGHPDPEATAARLARAAQALADRYGSLDHLAGEAGDTADLATRLSRLAPGIGVAAVLLFLRPLRDIWTAAGEVPLSPAARAAAVHLGVLIVGQDEEGEPGALRSALAQDPGAPALADVEAALDRLGRRACQRERVARCPLGADCPRA